MLHADKIDIIRRKYRLIGRSLDERLRRHWAAAEAEALGYGGMACVGAATGLSRTTIRAGLRELKTAECTSGVRRAGAGRKRLSEHNPALKAELEALVEPVTRGDPCSPLRWTCLSRANLAKALKMQGHNVSISSVGRLLRHMGYSLQANQKMLEGSSHPDRNAQFEHINEKVKEQLAAGNPVISVDTKKKELIGNFKNSGRELRPKGSPEKVNVHDFPTELGRANPYGVYDIANNVAWVSVGIDHDTATFAVESIRRWWKLMGSEFYKTLKELLITADGGGSNGSRVRLWKLELQRLADELNIPISVCHLPPGTSKWNKIEHRLFSFITQNWRGKPLITHQVVIDLIAATTTKTGLKVRCELDENIYPTGVKVAQEELDGVNIQRDPFHGEWNYKILPKGTAR
jgi:hypothetical protein